MIFLSAALVLISQAGFMLAFTNHSDIKMQISPSLINDKTRKDYRR
ncbi:hypothetical protein HMPREF3213_00002 [Heyndrickxia coagulans]|uniref:Uncharacterized protein n=1 Tax=Heyndrickxia coagulans TaxID=1398 RepID=A0A133L3Z4_HEYCO|nr:hypothetical protein HMPREF3213_00002 [Heyndrickxia coagulans]